MKHGFGSGGARLLPTVVGWTWALASLSVFAAQYQFDFDDLRAGSTPTVFEPIAGHRVRLEGTGGSVPTIVVPATGTRSAPNALRNEPAAGSEFGSSDQDLWIRFEGFTSHWVRLYAGMLERESPDSFSAIRGGRVDGIPQPRPSPDLMTASARRPSSTRSAVPLLETVLSHPTHGIAYHTGRLLLEQCPDQAMLECSSCGFDLDGFLDAGLATVTRLPERGHSQVVATWRGCAEDDRPPVRCLGEEGIRYRPGNAWLRVDWNGRSFEAVRVEWFELMRPQRTWFLLADDRSCLEAFYRTVCRWTAVPHGEVLVFEKGGWRKDRGFYASIRSASADDLVLSPGLKEELFADLRRFFGGSELYQRLGVPWKRGILLLGPPGNGKTHAIRALCRDLELPVLYVRSLEAGGMFQTGEQGHVAEVFELARHTAPCLLILEDLDTLITAVNRSVLLNELDGFAQNSGLCVLATTNYPERLDPSILDRPSRFDRKYTFDLPGAPERRSYLRLWSQRQSVELQLGAEVIEAIVQETEGFSFAYLKELCLASAMARVNAGPEERMDDLALAQARALQAQRRTVASTQPPEAPVPTREDLMRGLLESL